MKNVLVVGANGMIGSALYHYLHAHHVEVYGTTHHRDQIKSNIFYLNLLDPPETWVFPDKKFDVVYLCAGICKMALCDADPVITYQINVTKIFALINHFSQAGSHIIYLSTNQVFSGEEPFASPATAYCPPNEYGRQKVEIETLVKKHCSRWTILRLTKVLSIHLPLFQHWITQLQQQTSIEAFHDMMMAPVALSQVIEVLVKLGERKIIGCFQISGMTDISYFDFAKQLAQRLTCSMSQVKPVSALNAGIKKSFLSSYTTLDCSNTIAICGKMFLHPADVLNICLENGV